MPIISIHCNSDRAIGWGEKMRTCASSAHGNFSHHITITKQPCEPMTCQVFGEDVVMRGDSVARGKLGYKNSIWVFSCFSFLIPSLSLSLFCYFAPLLSLRFHCPMIILICRVAATQVTPATATAILRMMKLCLGGLDSFAKGASWILWCGFLQVFFGAGSYLIRYIVWAHHVKNTWGLKSFNLRFFPFAPPYIFELAHWWGKCKKRCHGTSSKKQKHLLDRHGYL